MLWQQIPRTVDVVVCNTSTTGPCQTLTSRLDAIDVAAAEERTTLENDLAAADAVLTRKLEDLASAEEKLSAAKDRKPINKEDFVDYGKKVVQPIFGRGLYCI